jgi:hypothetical protein
LATIAFDTVACCFDPFAQKVAIMVQKIYRLVTREADGSLRVREFETSQPILDLHEQIGIDDCSTELSLRGLPLFRGLVGPMPDGKGVARYESPEVFETLTKEWANIKIRRRSRRTVQAPQTESADV